MRTTEHGTMRFRKEGSTHITGNGQCLLWLYGDCVYLTLV